jgi:hypothetical protein
MKHLFEPLLTCEPGLLQSSSAKPPKTYPPELFMQELGEGRFLQSASEWQGSNGGREHAAAAAPPVLRATLKVGLYESHAEWKSCASLWPMVKDE